MCAKSLPMMGINFAIHSKIYTDMTPQDFFRSLVASDTVMAQVAYRGVIIASMKFNGIMTHSDIMQSVMSAMSKIRGTVTVTLRNISSGQVWKQTLALMPQPRQMQLCI